MASRQDLLTATQNIVNAVNLVSQQLRNVFPQAAALSSAVPAAGAVVFTSSQAASFLTVTTSSGGIYHVPLY
jgi:hypothetical protein